ncbi:chloride channel protein [Spongisporangium articulatum]|uniref:Chloride channel protein n=1 Tax=Spongisporangium articulatum TaxID=3362603 RepID=A0ABW8AP90_9ACTN
MTSLPLLVRRSIPPRPLRGWGEALRGSESGLLMLALVVGAGAGLGAVAFRWLILAVTKIFSGYDDYSAVGRAANPHVPWLGPWFLLLAPVISGLLYGPLVYRFAREARGHGVPEVMYAVARRGGRIAPRVAAVKALASALCIGGGGSVGREGPIVQIGSALGSTVGGLARLEEERLRVLVACGAAGGIAATFNAPLAGVFFAMELILRDFAGRAFGMVVLSSVTASVIGRAALGDEPFLHLAAFRVDHPSQYGWFVLLGVVAGAVGVAFTRVLYLIEDACDRVWRGPEWLRPAVGGLLLGALLLAVPQMYGVGYPVLGRGIAGDYTVAYLLLLLVAKVVGTGLTIGIGGSGGVFAPSLFVGAMLGSAYGQALEWLFPATAGSPGAYGLVAMGAVFAGAGRAPITAVIIMFELTGEYSIILPLMAAIVVATGISRLLMRDTIYTLKLRRRGVDLDAATPLGVPVAGLLEQRPGSVDADATALEAARLLTATGHAQLPVTDPHGAYLGVVEARRLTEVLADGRHDAAAVDHLLDHPPTLRQDDDLDAALEALDRWPGPVPVLAADGTTVVGWLTHRTVLAAVRDVRLRAPAATGRPPSVPSSPTGSTAHSPAGP